MRPRSYYRVVAFCIGCGVSHAGAQTSAASPSAVIGEIRATGSQHFTQTQVAAASGLKPGDKVTREQLQQIADRLARTGVFTKINYSFTTKDDKIALEFQLQDAPTVPVLFDNFPWFTDAELVAAIRDAEPLFDGASAPEDGAMLDEMTAALTKLLAAHNLTGRVTHQLTGQPFSDGMLMQFGVEDSSVPVAAVEYGDALAQASEKLRTRNTDLVGKPFSRFAIDVFENEQVLPVYLTAGHIRAQFGKPQVRLAGNPAQVTVALPIVPGPVFHLSEVAWNGQNVLKEPDLLTVFQLKSGDLADGAKIEAGWQRIQHEYEHRGYLDVKVDAHPQFDDAAGMVSYRVAIAEGPQYRMGSLVITGLSVDSERALRTYWHLAPARSSTAHIPIPCR